MTICRSCLVAVSLCLLTPTTFAGEPFGLEGDRTIVVWASPANLTQRGGSVLALEEGDRFDAIVFGELAERKWMAGSIYYRRSQRNQSAVPADNAEADTFVQVAIVYANSTRCELIRSAKAMFG